MTQGTPDISFVNPPTQPIKQSWQFSIRGVLIATAIIAVVLGTIAAPPLFAIIFGVLYLAVSAILTTSIFCSRGWFRAFAIGAAIPHFITYLNMFGGFRRPEDVLFAIAFSTIASFVVGLVSAITHGYFARRGGLVNIPNIPFLRKWLTNKSIN